MGSELQDLYDEYLANLRNPVPVTGNDRTPDTKLGTTDISGKSIPGIPGKGSK